LHRICKKGYENMMMSKNSWPLHLLYPRAISLSGLFLCGVEC
jgi:hypothetical protein